MITVTCQYTGIEFEARSKRSKNHPLVSQFLNDANKDGRRYRGAYDAAKGIFADIRNQGITDINEVMSLAADAYHSWQENGATPVIRRTAGDRIREQKNASRRRDAINKILKTNGYYWRKEEVGTEDDSLPGSYGAGIGEFSHYEWQLYAADGSPTTVSAAFKSIGQEIPV